MRSKGLAKINTTAILVVVLLGGSVAMADLTQKAEADQPWPKNPFVRQLVEDALPETASTWDGAAHARRGTRTASYTALGLLWRDERHDRAMAASILRELVELQYDHELGDDKHGVWRTRANETKVDYNWREFVGCSLILTLEEFGDRLPSDLVQKIRAALLRAAQGAKQRNVGADYTNIAIMSAFLMDYVGTREKREDLQTQGREKAGQIFDAYYEHKTFDEYNSPTYYGVNLLALGMWRKHACWDRMRDMGAKMEADLWRDIGEFYHADMRNMCGPFVRAYGMDMTDYVAITGVWIGMALGDKKLAPLPEGRGRKSGELSYSPVIAVLEPKVPRDVLPKLAEFRDGPRVLERVCSRGTVTARIEKDLMMGALQLKRRWEQHFPATIQWKAGSGLGWMMLHGTAEHVKPTVVGRELQIERTRESKDPLLLYIAAPGIDVKQVSGDTWKLPGLTLRAVFSKGVTLQSVNKVKHPWFGHCLEVRIQAEPTSTLIFRPLAADEKAVIDNGADLESGSNISTDTTSSGPIVPEELDVLVDDLADSTAAQKVKKAILRLAMERAANAIAVGYQDEADALYGDVAAALNQPALEFITPNADASNLYGFGDLRSLDNNPYLDQSVAKATSDLSSADVLFPRVTPDQAVFNGLFGATGTRTAPSLSRKYFWLFAHHQSPMRFDAELITRTLRRMHTFADLVNLNPLTSLGGDHDLWFDQFAIENAFSAFYEIAELHPNLLLPSQKKAWDNMMQSARNKIAKGSFSSWRAPWNYNIETAGNVGALNIGLYLDDAEIVNKVLEHAYTSMQMQRPDGAMPYHGEGRPSVNYHNVVIDIWSQIHEQTGYEPLREAIERSQWKGPTMGRTDEMWTSPYYKAWRWNIEKGTEAGNEYLASLTKNPYVRGQITRNNELSGGVSGKHVNTGSIVWYDADVPSLPLPENHTIADRNTGGPRAWYKNFTYAGSFRPWQGGDGYNTLIGAMAVEPDDGQANSILAQVTPSVWVIPEGDLDNPSHATVTDSEIAGSTVSKNYSIGTALHGIRRIQKGADVGPLSDWSARQVWIGLPDRILGLVSTVPNKADAKGHAVHGVLRLISGGTAGARELKKLEQLSDNHYRYGQLDIIIHEHSYSSVTGIVKPYRLKRFPATELTFSDRANEPDVAGNEKTYNADADFHFVVEVRPVGADPNQLSSVSRLGDQDLVGVEVVGKQRSFQVWLNAGEKDQTVSLSRDRLPAGRDSFMLSEGVLGKPVFQENIPGQTSLAAGQHAVVIVSDAAEDHENGWNSFSDMVGYPDMQVSGDAAFGRIAPGTYEDRTFTIVNDNETPLILGGTPGIDIVGDAAFSVVKDVSQATLLKGESTTFTLRFTPSEVRDYDAIAKIKTNISTNPIYEIALKGEGNKDIRLVQSSSYGASWEKPETWKNGLGASPGESYVVMRSANESGILRTPTGVEEVFPGEQLKIADGGTVLLKMADTGKLTVNRTVFDGGGVVVGNGPFSYTWSGLTQIERNGLHITGSGSINFAGPLTGTGLMVVTASQASFASGDWSGDLTIQGNATVTFDFGIARGRSLIISKEAVFDMAGRNHRFENVFIDGVPMSEGVYSAKDLGDGFIGEGTISVQPYQRDW